MRKIIVSIMLCVAIMSCDSIAEDGFRKINSIRQLKKSYFSIIEIDGCEYLHRVKLFAHKGDCKNPIHCYNN